MIGPDRYRWVQLLRLLSGIFLVVLALAVFQPPLTRQLGWRLAPMIDGLTLPALGSSAAGFTVRVTSEPGGARVLIDGADRGSTPLFTNVACEEEQEVSFVVTKEGFAPWRRVVKCREGGDLTVRARF